MASLKDKPPFRELRIRGRVHRVHLVEHPGRGAVLLCQSAPQCPVWTGDVDQGLRLVEEILRGLEREEDVFQLTLPRGPLVRADE